MESPLVIERVLALFADDNYAEAEPLLAQLLVDEPGHAEGMHYMAFVRRDQGRSAEGNAMLAESLRLAPERAEFHYHLGNAMEVDGRHEESAAAYHRAIALRPKYPRAMLNLGLVLQTLHRNGEAEAVLTELIALAPRSPSAHLSLGKLYDGQGRQEKAIPLVRRAAELDQRPITYAWLSTLLRQCYHSGEATAAQDQALVAAENGDAETWMALAESFGHDAALAARCVNRALAIEPANADAAFMLATLEGRPSEAAPDGYISRIYDNYADHFDDHLVNSLNYRGPQLVHEAVMAQLAPAGNGPTAPLDILDAGCGTGLSAPYFKPVARSLTGIDLSRKMIAQAERRGLYDRLEVVELTGFLAAHPNSYDLLLAVDVLIHLGDLTAVFGHAAGALRPGGLFALSIETEETETFVLQSSGRFAYSVAYLRGLAAANDLAELSAEDARLRIEGNVPVFGAVMVLQKAR